MATAAKPSGPTIGRAAVVGLEDPVLAVLYAALARLAAGRPVWIAAFAGHLTERMSIFLPEVRARLVADLMLTKADWRQPLPAPDDPAQQCFLTINVVEALACLPPEYSTEALASIAPLGWTKPWLELARRFVSGTCDANTLEFAAMPCAAPQIPLRGAWTGSLRVLRQGPHTFARHTLSGGVLPKFGGGIWPASHTLWLKASDHIELGDQRLDLQGLDFLRSHQLPSARRRYMHLGDDAAWITSNPADAATTITYQNGCVIADSKSLRVNGHLCEGATAVLPDDRIEVDGMAMSALRLMRLMNTGATHPAPWQVRLNDVSMVFKDGSRGLDKVSFSLQSGDLVAVIGPSGCGKSTLLSLLTGELRHQSGTLEISKCAGHTPVFALVPQDDVLFPELTVQENLASAASLRSTDDAALLPERIQKALAAVSLERKSRLRVGSVVDKVLSGGERKRLNIAMELVGTPHALLLDEPTSGLSSADAGSVMTVLRSHADAGMLVVSVIHQPSLEMFELYDKVIVLDVGGRLACFSTPSGVRHYFESQASGHAGGRWAPDHILETLMGRRTTLDGRVQRRTFGPTFWQLRFEAERALYEPPLVCTDDAANTAAILESPDQSVSLLKKLSTVLHREWLRRLREWRGSLAAAAIALILACVIGIVCRVQMPGLPYAFKDNPNLPAFCFLAVILIQFLGLSASVQELVKDRAHRQRERLLHVPPWCWLIAKLPGLILLVTLQAGLVVLCGGAIIRLPYAQSSLWLSLALTGWCSVAMGLLVSALPRMTERVAMAAVPLLLVPQMILCGARPFEFGDLRHLHWPFTVPAKVARQAPPPPWIAAWMPSRWAYQATVCGLRDDPQVASLKDFPSLLKTYNLVRNNIELWQRNRDEFHRALAAALGNSITDDEARARIRAVIRAGACTADEIADALGDFMPEARSTPTDLVASWNDPFIEYAVTHFPAPPADASMEIVNQSRRALLWQSIVLLLLASVIMRISPRRILDLLGHAKKRLHRKTASPSP